ncbi:MAG: 16S rRNA (guanine(527)-N(7))-methyltransferase RsmG [Pseudomonadota bacterium]|nr:16S rRNA (guanine(527)-N(7))-methyltransferase RsmG [Pseudomonadota bacterium]
MSASQSQALAHYAALLQRWNKVHNLTAIETPAQVLTHHLLDSLAIVPEVQRVAGGRSVQVLDVGAGGGLPGIPLAIAAPHLQVTLVDKVQKKIAFLTQAKLELALTNVACIHARVETLQTESPFQLITARAFASLATLVGLTRHLLAPNGWWCVMKGTLPSAELDELQRSTPDVRVAHTVRLNVPRLDAERHLVWMQLARQ